MTKRMTLCRFLFYVAMSLLKLPTACMYSKRNVQPIEPHTHLCSMPLHASAVPTPPKPGGGRCDKAAVHTFTRRQCWWGCGACWQGPALPAGPTPAPQVRLLGACFAVSLHSLCRGIQPMWASFCMRSCKCQVSEQAYFTQHHTIVQSPASQSMHHSQEWG